jgi:sterol 3beta-glucosyltransferase
VFLHRVNWLRERAGLSPHHDVMTQSWASQRLHLVAVSPSICSAPSDWGENHRIVGFLNQLSPLDTEELPPGLADFIEDGAPPVYFTFGSMMLLNREYIKETAEIWIETTRRLGCRGVLQLPCEDLAVFAHPSSIFMVRRSPYMRIFPKCSVIVHHGGAGTTQCALLSGRPSVVVAHMADQFFWGSELERLGVAGPTVKRTAFSATRLAKSISRALSLPDMGKRSSAIGVSISKENGVSVAVKLIEDRLLPPLS